MFPMLLLILLLLLGVPAGLRWRQMKREEFRTKVRADLLALRTALTVYELDNEAFPSGAQGLDALLRSPPLPPAPKNWRGPYWATTALPLDPWGNLYVYRFPGSQMAYDLFSPGPDGKPGTNDDIMS